MVSVCREQDLVLCAGGFPYGKARSRTSASFGPMLHRLARRFARLPDPTRNAPRAFLIDGRSRTGQ
jgi:hypothetical protein